MVKFVITFALACASIHSQVAAEPPSTNVESANQIIEWNRDLLARVRTSGARAAVDAIDGTHHLFVTKISRISPDALAEVKFGIGWSTTASGDEPLIGQFWNRAIQNHWNVIAQKATSSQVLAAAQGGHSKGTLADGVNAFYDAKYTYNLWHAVTAIRAGETRNNLETDNLTWLPRAGHSSSDPSYPGAQGAIVTFRFQAGLTTLLRKFL